MYHDMTVSVKRLPENARFVTTHDCIKENKLYLYLNERYQIFAGKILNHG